MADLADLQARRVKLEKALHSGALTVKHGEKQVTYRSVEELKRALDSLDTAIAQAQGRKRNRRIYIDARRGY